MDQPDPTAAIRAKAFRDAAVAAQDILTRWPSLEAMKADGISGPHTMASAIAWELRRLAFEAQQQPEAPTGLAQRCYCGQPATAGTIQTPDGHTHTGPPLPPMDPVHILGIEADAGAQQQPETESRPARGDQFEAWLKAQRDRHERHGESSEFWHEFDRALDEYRLHADTGTPLSEHVCEGRAVGDCECLETQPTTDA